MNYLQQQDYVGLDLNKLGNHWILDHYMWNMNNCMLGNIIEYLPTQVEAKPSSKNPSLQVQEFALNVRLVGHVKQEDFEAAVHVAHV